MKNAHLNLDAVVSVSVCAVLVFIGTIRMLSYSEGAMGVSLRHSVAGFLCYDPGSPFSTRFFKLLATPSVVAPIYFFFRWRNAGLPSGAGATGLDRAHRLDFRSPTLRIILTSVITIHWFVIEWWKFRTEGFYPWSVLENRWLNLGVLLVGQALTFWAMKHLSFAPVFRPGTRT